LQIVSGKELALRDRIRADPRNPWWKFSRQLSPSFRNRNDRTCDSIDVQD